MAPLSQEAKLADEVSAHCNISTNAVLRVFYALKDLGYTIERTEKQVAKLAKKLKESETPTNVDANESEPVTLSEGTA